MVGGAHTAVHAGIIAPDDVSLPIYPAFHNMKIKPRYNARVHGGGG